MISLYLTLLTYSLDSKYQKYLRACLHEFIHIIYNETIASERIIWLDEGLAMNLSREHKGIFKNKSYNLTK